MSKIFANKKPHGLAPPVHQPSEEAAQGVVALLTGLIVLAIAGGVCVLLYHYWRLALAFLLAAVVFACGLSRAGMFVAMCALLVALAILGNSARAEAVVDGDTIRLNGTTWSLWGYGRCGESVMSAVAIDDSGLGEFPIEDAERTWRSLLAIADGNAAIPGCVFDHHLPAWCFD